VPFFAAGKIWRLSAFTIKFRDNAYDVPTSARFRVLYVSITLQRDFVAFYANYAV